MEKAVTNSLNLIINSHFNDQKKSALSQIDLSRKSSIDEQILEIVNLLTLNDNFYTTSSCSGRVMIISNAHDNVVPNHSAETSTSTYKKGANWIFSSHDVITEEDRESQLSDVWNSLQNIAQVVLKFEPFILHVQCRDLAYAKHLHQIVIECGLRNSGITVGKGNRLNLAIRSTISLEVPVTDYCGVCLFNYEYFEYLLTKTVGEKFELNQKQRSRLLTALQNNQITM